jgi:hypothetical protein
VAGTTGLEVAALITRRASPSQLIPPASRRSRKRSIWPSNPLSRKVNKLLRKGHPSDPGIRGRRRCKGIGDWGEQLQRAQGPRGLKALPTGRRAARRGGLSHGGARLPAWAEDLHRQECLCYRRQRPPPPKRGATRFSTSSQTRVGKIKLVLAALPDKRRPGRKERSPDKHRRDAKNAEGRRYTSVGCMRVGEARRPQVPKFFTET